MQKTASLFNNIKNIIKYRHGYFGYFFFQPFLKYFINCQKMDYTKNDENDNKDKHRQYKTRICKIKEVFFYTLIYKKNIQSIQIKNHKYSVYLFYGNFLF